MLAGILPSLVMGRLFTIKPLYTNTKTFLKVVKSTWFSITNDIQPRVCTKFSWRLFIAALFLSLWLQYRVKRVICKTWTGTLASSAGQDQTPQNTASDQGLHCLVKLQEVLRPRSGLFSQPTYRDNRPTGTVRALILYIGWFSLAMISLKQH